MPTRSQQPKSDTKPDRQVHRNFKLPRALDAELGRRAAAMGLSRSEVNRRALRVYLQNGANGAE
jgi:hypothetical protein